MNVERVSILSWIQNFFKRFSSDKEEILEEDVTNNEETVNRQSSPVRTGGSKDIETRITFQYPRGHFRFPVIPDEENPAKHRREHPHHEHHFKEHHQVQAKWENPHSERVKPPLSYLKTPRNEPLQSVQTQQPKRYGKQPFRPTEIPSPVYGFHRPKQEEDNVVEYELSHISHDDRGDLAVKSEKSEIDRTFPQNPFETAADAVKAAPFKEEAQEEVDRGEEPIAAFSENGEEQDVELAAYGILSIGGQTLIQTEQSREAEKPNGEMTETLSEEKSSSFSAGADASGTGSPLSIQTGLPVDHERAELDESLQTKVENSLDRPEHGELFPEAGSLPLNQTAISNETEAMAAAGAEAETADELESALEQIREAGSTKSIQMDLADEADHKPENTEALATVTIDKTSHTGSMDTATEELQVSSAAGPEKTASADSGHHFKEASAAPEKPERRHLPFNVLMLKQDKQKWEERKKAGAPVREPLAWTTPKISEEAVRPAGESGEGGTFQPDNGALYQLPSLQLLKPPVVETLDSDWLTEQEILLNQTLENFNVGAKVVNVTQGPAVTRFEVHPEPGVKVNKVTNLTDDIKLSLAAKDIRIEAPIPGKHTIGIEVPNLRSRPVQISEIIQSPVFLESASPLTAVLGLDISGKPIVTDLKKMPHGLIAGATGSGKSVCINSILVSLLYKASPEDLRLLLIDPKMVELAPYNRIPHLVSPVITDVKAATAALKWAVDEMERRYELFAHTGVRDINRFNELAIKHKQYADKLAYIVIVIDELADLMMMSPADVEEAICRIAQKARACGIHLIIATQRPSVDVITGLIKANIPTRIAFSVSSQVDSRTIIDISGAEKLLGRGDMLFLENGASKPVRIQGTFVSDEEIDLVVDHIRKQREPDYLFEQNELLKKEQMSEDEDELFYEACEFVVSQSSASTSSLQRRFKIGYNRAARLMDMLEKRGFISGANGSKPREVFLTESDLESIQE